MEKILSFKLKDNDVVLAKSEENVFEVYTSELEDFLELKGKLKEVYDFYDPIESTGHKQTVVEYVDVFDWLENQTDDEVCETISLFITAKRSAQDVFQRLGNILNPNHV